MIKTAMNECEFKIWCIKFEKFEKSQSIRANLVMKNFNNIQNFMQEKRKFQKNLNTCFRITII